MQTRIQPPCTAALVRQQGRQELRKCQCHLLSPPIPCCVCVGGSLASAHCFSSCSRFGVPARPGKSSKRAATTGKSGQKRSTETRADDAFRLPMTMLCRRRPTPQQSGQHSRRGEARRMFKFIILRAPVCTPEIGAEQVARACVCNVLDDGSLSLSPPIY